jgi:hypothetical protein
MMKRLAMGLLIGALGLGAGCGSGESGGGAGSGGHGGAGGSGAGGGSSGSGGSGGAGSCNTLANIGTDVPVTTDPGPAPAMTGGTIVDGTYVLTSQVNYAGATLGSGALKQTFVITGNTVQVVQSGMGGPDEHSTIIQIPSGNQLTFTYSCPTARTLTVPYTATPTTFAYDLGNWVLTASKR